MEIAGNSQLVYLSLIILMLCSMCLLAFVQRRKRAQDAEFLEHLGQENENLKSCLGEAKNLINETERKLKIESDNHKRVEEELRLAIRDAENATRIKAEFLATMSHEIRTPMNGVLGMTELLLKTELNNKQVRFAEAIHQSGEALLTIINDVLDFSKIEAGKLELKEEAFDLRQLIEDTSAMFARKAEQQAVELASTYPVNSHTAFNGDPIRIRQLLTNLIGNAMKFTEKGDVLIKLAFLEETDSHALVQFSVSDTGIGIKQELCAHVFDSFTQVDGSMTRQYGGTGLGLAICKKLVELMDGEIGLDSEFGKGSTFWFRLKLNKDDAGKLRNTRGLKNGSISGAKILLVDSNETICRITQAQVEGWGAQYESAANAKTALHKLYLAEEQGHPFDIVLLDKQLPDMNGITLTKKLRQDEKLKNTRVIILSSIAQLAESGEWMLAGVEAYLNKPLRQSDLFNCLVKVYANSQDQTQPMRIISTEEGPEENQEIGGHVLVAEDNPINKELITQMLENFGCRFKFVYNGKEALDAVTNYPLDRQTDPYDMILMDCQMPEMDGFEATAEIRKWEAMQQDSHIPIVALTANALQGDRQRCLDSGMDDYLSKPFTSNQLFGILKQWLPLEVSKDIKESPVSTKEVADKGHVSSLDPEAISRIKQLQRADSANMLLKIIDLYLEKSPELMQEISQAISTGDADKLRHAAHSLKSSSASLGANEMASLCSELEKMGRDNNLENALGKLDFLEFEFEGVCRALQFESQKEAA